MPSEAAPAVELDAQYRALREECGLLDRSARGKITIAGAEGAEYLQGQLTNDVEALAPGEGCYALLLDRKGHIRADMRVLRRRSDEIWLDLEPEATEAALRHLRTYSVGRDLAIEDVGESRAILSLIGPASASVSGFEGLGPEHAQRPGELGGIEALAVATEHGVDLIVGAEERDALRSRLLGSGAEEVGEDAAEIIRIESGRPRFGRDFGPALMPAEAGLVERAIDFEKGCYIGQEPVARLHYRGRPNRRLRGLRLAASASPGASLRLGDREVGQVGSACVSPAFGPIALAVIRREAEPGTSLELEGGGSAELVELPFRE